MAQRSRHWSPIMRASSLRASWLLRRSPSRARSMSSISPSRLRVAASAGDLPLDGQPTSACHSTSGSAHAADTRAITPAPHRALTAASSAWAT
jgi:hypothetical protein